MLRVSVNTSGRSGTLEKHVSIHSSDALQPLFPLTVTATVRPQMAGGAHP